MPPPTKAISDNSSVQRAAGQQERDDIADRDRVIIRAARRRFTAAPARLNSQRKISAMPR